MEVLNFVQQTREKKIVCTYCLTYRKESGDYLLHAFFPGRSRQSVTAPIHRSLAKTQEKALSLAYTLAQKQVSPWHLADVLEDLTCGIAEKR